MEDMTPNKRQTGSPTKSITTPTEKRTQKRENKMTISQHMSPGKCITT